MTKVMVGKGIHVSWNQCEALVDKSFAKPKR